ncbi:MAG: toll/interleukin-1 receptor domain-containing protein [Rubrivivax sp.]
MELLGLVSIVGLALAGGVAGIWGWLSRRRRQDDRPAAATAAKPAPPAALPPDFIRLDKPLPPPVPAQVPQPVPPAPAAPPDFDPFTAPTADLYIGPAPQAPQPSGAEPPAADQSAPEPVLIGVTAPESGRPGGRFNAVLAVYIEAARAAAEAQLRRLGGPQGVPLLDLPPDRQSGWLPGAPVTVRLSAPGAVVEPAERRFDWNGRLNLAAFSVQMAAGAQGALDLCFQVELAGVPIALLPLPVAIAGEQALVLLNRQDRQAPASAFASYASKDAQTVGYCLSALSRWSPGLAIFQDCLDLQPNEAFKPQLRQRIHDSDCFLLFWSRHASASKWVRWELDTARDDKGLDAVIPMPLEDPAIAAPPPEFEAVHLRDRFMMARYGLARIQDEAAAPRPPA